MYDEPSRTIYLPEGWAADSPIDVSMLVHELVHHLQHAGGLEYDCPEAQDRHAYQAQERWLNLFDTSLSDEFGIRSEEHTSERQTLMRISSADFYVTNKKTKRL